VNKRAPLSSTSQGSHVRESPLDRLLHWTEFNDQWAKTKKQHRSSLRGLARRIMRTRGETKSDLPWLKLATFGKMCTNKGALRTNANMIAINGIELDYDDGDLTWNHAWGRLYEARLPALLYTTRRHTAEQPRFRVLLATSRPLAPAERARLVARAYGVLKGTIDGASFTPSQCFYYGSAAGVPIWVDLIEHPAGRYIDEADDLDAGALDKNGKPWNAVASDAHEDDDDDDIGGLHSDPDIDRIKRDLSHIPCDERETWLRVGQALHHEFGADEEGFALWDSWSQSSYKYDEYDQRRVWESLGQVVGKPITIATVHALAKKHKPAASGDLTFHTPAECAAASPRPYLIKTLLAAGDFVCIFGAPGAGKSLFGPHIGYRVARGEPAFGMRTKPGIVFYVAAEDASGLKQRVAALRLRHGDAPNFRVVGGVSDLFTDDSSNLASLTKAVVEQRPVVIFIDTLAMAFPGLEENDAKSMQRVIDVSRQLAEHGAAVVLIHHDTKAGGGTPRGHSKLDGALDMAIHVKRDSDGIVRGKLTKNRNGTTDRDIAFRIGTEELGADEDGDPITAALVEELSGIAAERPKNLAPSQREALAILEELELKGAVTSDGWLAACVDGSRVSQSESTKSRRDVFNRARNSLLQAGLIGETGKGHVFAKREMDDDVMLDDEE